MKSLALVIFEAGMHCGAATSRGVGTELSNILKLKWTPSEQILLELREKIVKIIRNRDTICVNSGDTSKKVH